MSLCDAFFWTSHYLFFFSIPKWFLDNHTPYFNSHCRPRPIEQPFNHVLIGVIKQIWYLWQGELEGIIKTSLVRGNLAVPRIAQKRSWFFPSPDGSFLSEEGQKHISRPGGLDWSTPSLLSHAQNHHAARKESNLMLPSLPSTNNFLLIGKLNWVIEYLSIRFLLLIPEQRNFKFNLRNFWLWNKKYNLIKYIQFKRLILGYKFLIYW